jgi:hypothetical protein
MSSKFHRITTAATGASWASTGTNTPMWIDSNSGYATLAARRPPKSPSTHNNAASAIVTLYSTPAVSPGSSDAAK